eukprot:1157126-Pelagomonas_calceolata.AAC.2
MLQEPKVATILSRRTRKQGIRAAASQIVPTGPELCLLLFVVLNELRGAIIPQKRTRWQEKLTCISDSSGKAASQKSNGL